MQKYHSAEPDEHSKMGAVLLKLLALDVARQHSCKELL